ncbi:DUF1015 family protein [Mycoplasma elephantis]|uniref:DUF1015 family protein n=1 Tax=Mycoplasma elephantis TaxID=114882 RepID=UPI000487F4E9|nr:DUF1015 family protein [Mycoplasma elephantis]
MKILVIKESYINKSGNIYNHNYINLANIKKSKIVFNNKTLFLTDKVKRQLNEEKIEKNTNSIYIFKNNDYYGLIADLDMEEYKNKNIISHELVYPNIIQGMISNTNLYNSEANPVFITYKENINFEEIINKKTYDKKYDFGNIVLYLYTKNEAKNIINKFKNIKKMWIADGHHRFYSTSFLKNKKSILTCFMSFNQIKILSIHRLIRNVDGQTFEMGKKFISKFLKISDNNELKKGYVRITYQNNSFIVKLNNNDDNMFWNNDIYKLNTQIITTAFRIQDLGCVEFIPDYELEKVKNIMKSNDILIETVPIDVNSFIELANHDYILPPKSTCFVPKFPSFLVFKKYK